MGAEGLRRRYGTNQFGYFVRKNYFGSGGDCVGVSGGYDFETIG